MSFQKQQIESIIAHKDVTLIPGMFRRCRFLTGYKYGPHQHTAVEINYVWEGNCIMKFDKNIVKFHKGDCMLLFPNVEHFFRTIGQNGVTLYQLEFDIKNIETLIKPEKENENLSFLYHIFTHSSQFIKFRSDKTDAIFNCLQRIIKEEKQKTNREFSDLMLKLYYSELVLICSRLINDSTNFDKIRENKRLNAALDIIHNTYSEADMTIEDIAKKCGTSSRYLRSLFQQELHISPAGYINQLRINKSCELLINEPKARINDIAYRSGFSSPQYFSYVFSKSKGISPSSFVKNYFRIS